MPSPARRAPFVGRERELGLLHASLDAARAGDGGIALVAGEPGIGKTRLLSEFATQARRLGWIVLTGRAYETAGMPPYLPLLEALRAYTHGRAAAELRLVLGTSVAAVARLLPELQDALPAVPETPALPPEQERDQLFEGLAAALVGIARAGESGLLLLLDDLHWADASSLAFLQHLAHKLAGAPLLVAVGYRTLDPRVTGTLQETLAEFVHEEVTTSVPPVAFGRAEIGALMAGVAGVTPAPAVVAAVHTASGGNPFFAGELVRQLQSQGRDLADPRQASVPLGVPEGVRQVVGGRLGRLSEPAQGLLQVAALLDDGFSVALLRQASGLPEAVLGEALDEALAVGMLQEEQHGYAFAHALIRQTVQEGLSLTRRQRLHQQVGRALEQRYARPLEEHASQLAAHFAHSSDPDELAKAVHYGEVAAQRAMRVYAYAEAARLLEQALAVQEVLDAGDAAARCDLLLALSDAVVPAGVHLRALEELLPEAFRMAEVAGDHNRAAMAADRAMWVGERTRAVGETLYTAARQEWLERLDRHAQPGTAARRHADLRRAEFVRHIEHHGEAVRQLSSIVLNATRNEDYETVYLALAPALHPITVTTWLETQRLALASADLPRTVVVPAILYQPLMQLITHLLDAGDRRRAEHLGYELETLAERTGETAGRLRVLNVQTMIALLDGRLSDVQALSDAAVGLGRAHDLEAEGRTMPANALFRCLLLTGEAEAAASVANDIPAMARRASARVLALVQRGLNGTREAAQLLDTVSSGRDLGEDVPIGTVINLLEIALLLREREWVASFAAILRPLAASCVGGANLVVPARLLGEAATLLGGREQALDYLRQALLAASSVDFRPEIALTRLALAELPQGGDAGEQQDAAQHLAFCIPEFEAMGMAPALARARLLQDRIASAPEPSSSPVAAYPDGLTAREVQVLRLVAAGMSNREIATALVISVNTVLQHVRSVLTKTGVTNRTGAAAYAVRQGLVE